MDIYSVGSNGSGQLGIGHRDDISIPNRCIVDDDAKDEFAAPTTVCAGGNHTLILFSSGRLYFCGTHKPHQDKSEDLPFEPPSLRFEQVHIGRKLHLIKYCSATWSTSTIVTTDDRVLTWGVGEKGELGRGQGKLQMMGPSQPLDFSNALSGGISIINIASGVHHTVVVLSDGTIYGWGNGRKGQLGEPSEIVWEPRKIEGLSFRAIRAVCGREFTFILGCPEEGRFAILGVDKWKLRSDAPIAFPRWRDVGASWGSIFVLNHQNKIISWGRNDHGQLAPADLPPIQQMAIGSEHGLVLTEHGSVLAWGWGEHGNCGSQTDKQGDVKPRWNEIWTSDSSKYDLATGIGAGCATSWIWTSSFKTPKREHWAGE